MKEEEKNDEWHASPKPKKPLQERLNSLSEKIHKAQHAVRNDKDEVIGFVSFEIYHMIRKQERNKAIDVQKILTNSEGSNHLKWIYDRMIYVLGENPNMDYMHKFKSIIEKLTAHGEY